MLSKLELTKFRGFNKHSIKFRNMALVVGKNNAGKSTIVEALRLVALVTQRASSLTFREPPKWITRPTGSAGVSPSLANIDFEFTYIIHGYGKPPAVIKAIFSDGKEIIIYLNNDAEEMFVVLRDQNKKPLISRSQLVRNPFHKVSILPPIFPVQKHEPELRKSYVRGKMATNLASSHFRNQLYIFDDPYQALIKLAEKTWKGVQVKSIDTNRPKGRRLEINLWIRDGRHVAEIADVGHGLQSWLQILWFLVRTPENHTIILDEPDVYLHADLQRRLIQILSSRHKQVIIATHSIEMMSEVSPESMLIVDKESLASRYADNFPAAQSVVDALGAPHNLQLAKLWKAKRCVFLEGDDIEFFRIFYQTIFPDALDVINEIPMFPLDGAGNWRDAKGAADGFKRAKVDGINVYCVLDTDFRLPEEKADIIAKTTGSNLAFKFWTRKEIENYLLVPEAIARFIIQGPKVEADLGEIEALITSQLAKICEDLRRATEDDFAEQYGKYHHGHGVKKANQWARSYVREFWKTDEGKITVIPGKRAFSSLSRWSKKKFGVSFSAKAIARNLIRKEIGNDLVDVITAINDLKPLK